jgi:Calcineurin-like phosphoesterase superfamily domain
MDARGTAHPFRARLQVLGQVPARIPSVAAAAIAIISDTHLPRGNRRLPADCVSRMRAADLIIIHAGDLTTASMLEQLRAIGEVAAVHGNADDAAVRAAANSPRADGRRCRAGDRARRRRREGQARAVAAVIHRGRSSLPLFEGRGHITGAEPGWPRFCSGPVG